MKNALVSIITPCYNKENKLYRLLDSVIGQTYRPIEFILVDDGSTDQSLIVAENYREKFEQAKIDYIVIHQVNKGLAASINAGLGKVKGEYICWPDADDYLESTSIEERVNALKEHPECAVVTSNAYVRYDGNEERIELLVDSALKIHNSSKQFINLLEEKSIYCCGCHMAKANMFFEVNPDRKIYPARRGQNWQMLLPLYFKYDRYFLNKPLYNYVMYQNSMSRGDDGYERRLYRFNEHEIILQETLTKIQTVQGVDMTKYIHYVKDRYSKFRMELAIEFGNTVDFAKEYQMKKNSIGVDIGDRVSCIRSRFKILNKPLSWVCRGSRFIQRQIRWNFK